jgi:hypothetical protein
MFEEQGVTPTCLTSPPQLGKMLVIMDATNGWDVKQRIIDHIALEGSKHNLKPLRKQ